MGNIDHSAEAAEAVLLLRPFWWLRPKHHQQKIEVTQ